MLAIRFRSSSVTDVSDLNEVGRLMLVQGLRGLNKHVGLLHMKNLLGQASSPPNGIHWASSEKQRVPTGIFNHNMIHQCTGYNFENGALFEFVFKFL